jgi:succinate dehydrogenase / fumarate reductase iron-sulfur subunit
MALGTYTFKVFRYDSESGAEPRFDAFTLEEEQNQSVLGALQEIQDRFDPSLAFRYSCRGAVCGSCGMSVNGAIVLACRTLLQDLAPGPITVEPLPNLTVLKDLVVDLDPFWKAYRAVEPWLHTEGDAVPEKEFRVSPKEEAGIDRYVNCILCACCYGACPVPGRDPEYLGPAALAKLWRFVGDVRDRRGFEVVRRVDDVRGVWGCDTVFKCVDACPKDVRPTDGIAALRRHLVAGRLSRRKG